MTGMAYVQPDPYYLPVRSSSLIRGGFYCPRCDANYWPGLVWGYETGRHRNDTTGAQHLIGCKRLGDECPFCGRLPLGSREGEAPNTRSGMMGDTK